jgi:hypothetical protein
MLKRNERQGIPRVATPGGGKDFSIYDTTVLLTFIKKDQNSRKWGGNFITVHIKSHGIALPRSALAYTQHSIYIAIQVSCNRVKIR